MSSGTVSKFVILYDSTSEHHAFLCKITTNWCQFAKKQRQNGSFAPHAEFFVSLFRKNSRSFLGNHFRKRLLPAKKEPARYLHCASFPAPGIAYAFLNSSARKNRAESSIAPISSAWSKCSANTAPSKPLCRSVSVFKRL